MDPIINACLDHRFDEAVKDAKEIDIFISSGTKSEADIEQDTPLLGVPFSVKEFIGVKGKKELNNKSKVLMLFFSKQITCLHYLMHKLFQHLLHNIA